MKTDKQFELLREWIEAIVDEKIEQAFSRNSSLEEMRRRRVEEQLINLIEERRDGNESEVSSEEDNFKR
jgi:hypothetical protein